MIMYQTRMRKKGRHIIMDVSDRIVSMLYTEREIIESSTYTFFMGN